MISALKGLIATKFCTHLRNCAKKKFPASFLLKIAYFINYDKVFFILDPCLFFVIVNHIHFKDQNLHNSWACISDIKHWSVHNCLKLNADKTEVLHFTSKFRQSHKLESVTLDEGVVNTIADSARNLGVKLDKHLTLNYYINDTCRAASFALHKIGTIRQFLNRKSTERLVHAHVMSRIDFCNSILYGLPDMQINKLDTKLCCQIGDTCSKVWSHHPYSTWIALAPNKGPYSI